MVGIYGVPVMTVKRREGILTNLIFRYMLFMARTTISGNFLAKEGRGAGYNFPNLDGGTVRFHPDFSLSPTTCCLP
jgi:hypothetical protein